MSKRSGGSITAGSARFRSVHEMIQTAVSNDKYTEMFTVLILAVCDGN